jgi:hypothetical protein
MQQPRFISWPLENPDAQLAEDPAEGIWAVFEAQHLGQS